MKLLELNPVWIEKDGKRIGFTFISPANPQYRQSCFIKTPPSRKQWALFAAQSFKKDVQGCREGTGWNIEGGIDNADFSTITITPSLDGSAGGLWHGFIRGGEIV